MRVMSSYTLNRPLPYSSSTMYTLECVINYTVFNGGLIMSLNSLRKLIVTKRGAHVKSAKAFIGVVVDGRTDGPWC